VAVERTLQDGYWSHVSGTDDGNQIQIYMPAGDRQRKPMMYETSKRFAAVVAVPSGTPRANACGRRSTSDGRRSAGSAGHSRHHPARSRRRSSAQR
jgi:hypothetical protein